ncbi:MAG: preprotein translocase subunit SecG [Oscillospiraceae bacterium]
MGIFEIISAIVLIIACVFIVIVVLMADTKTQMSQTISGNSGDNYFGKNSGRTKEAMLNKATVIAAIVFFVLAVLVNVFNVYFGGSKSDDTSSGSTGSETSIVVETDTAETTAEVVVTAEAPADTTTAQAESDGGQTAAEQ